MVLPEEKVGGAGEEDAHEVPLQPRRVLTKHRSTVLYRVVPDIWPFLYSACRITDKKNI